MQAQTERADNVMESLSGMVADIIFENRENGYMVCEFVTEAQDEVVIVGCLPFIGTRR